MTEQTKRHNTLVHKKPEHKKELWFMVGMIFKGIELYYEPRFFYLSDGTKYTPDFYDPKEDTYYEVVGSRQAWHRSRNKICLFQNDYPLVNFKIVFLAKVKKLCPEKTKSKIREYLIKNNIRQQDFAKTLNISNCYLSELINFKKNPTIDRAYEIEKITNGFVTFYDYRAGKEF